MRILIDASTSDEVRVGMINKGGELLEYFFEDTQAAQVKGSIFLGKVTRVEPSLQAAFIDYGADRGGFLPFREIHPDYFKIPQADQKERKEKKNQGEFSLSFDGAMESTVLETTEEEEDVSFRSRLQKHHKRYKIQEVVKPNQVILVQIVKEERQTKGAALTTFVTLPGRYCVFLPNSPHGGGVSKRIRDPQMREKLQEVVSTFKLEEGSSFVVRSACEKQIKANLKRDYSYLKKVWERVRAKTMESHAPSLVYREFNAALRVVRDLWTEDVEGASIAGEEQYKTIRAFLKEYAPRQASKLKLYTEKEPLFAKYSIDNQVDALFEPIVYLPSGGHIVINQTEALVSIDVNSGRATKERHIEETALATNVDAAKEIARQVRLRDLSGLFVVDFIDMEDAQHRAKVEKAMHDSMAADRARVQIGRISNFGLLEMSRQRLGFSAMDKIMSRCPKCDGVGVVKKSMFLARQLLRALEHVVLYGKGDKKFVVHAPQSVCLIILTSYADLLQRCKGEAFVAFSVVQEDGVIRISDATGRTAWCERASDEDSES